MKRTIRGVTPGADRMLRQCRWPGNVRQLRNAVEGAFAVAQGELLCEADLAESLGTRPEPPSEAVAAALPDGPISLSREVERYERELIRRGHGAIRFHLRRGPEPGPVAAESEIQAAKI